MCIAILNKFDLLSKSILKECWANNPDGAGFAYATQGNVYVYKELRSFKTFYKAYKSVRLVNDLPMIIHFRIATSGLVNDVNCHPFQVRQDMAFIHNGMLSCQSTETHSDTWHFNELLRGLPHGFELNKSIMILLQNASEGSKLVLLDGCGRYNIIHENAGHWNGDDWFSNYSYIIYKTVYKSLKWGYGDMDYYDNISDADKYLCEACNDTATDWLPAYSAAVCKQCKTYYSNEDQD